MEGGGLGVVPDACKEGNMGNRNLYHFCLAILIFLDIMVPLTLLAIAALTIKDKRLFNKTLGGASADSNASAPDTAPISPCCTSALGAGALVLGLIMFLIFVTIAGQLGQSSTAFCNGYVSIIEVNVSAGAL